MKKLLLTTAACTAAASALFAQSLSINAPGYSGGKLFDASPGFTITGLAAAPGGDVFYIETDSAFNATSKLYRRSAGDGYAVATTLFDFGSSVFGSFVRWDSGRVFFGESSTGAVRLMRPDLSIDALGSVAGNYDAALAGGSLFLSHNAGGFSPQNKVSRYDLVPDGGGGLALGAADTIVDTPDDYSGPIVFSPAGDLFYGGSGFFARPNLYRFTAAEVAAATGAGPTLGLDAPHQFFANGTNAYLALADIGTLWHTDFGTLDRIDLGAVTSAPIASSPDFGIGQLDVADGTLFAAVTNSSFDHSAVFWVVPEPSSALLLVLGLAALTPRRRCRMG